MDTIQLILGNVFTLISYAVVLTGVYKLHQMVTELGEIKELLRDVKRNTEDALPSEPGSPQSHEALLRAIENEEYPSAPVESEKSGA